MRRPRLELADRASPRAAGGRGGRERDRRVADRARGERGRGRGGAVPGVDVRRGRHRETVPDVGPERPDGALRLATSERRYVMARLFVYDAREFPDPDSTLSVEDVRKQMTDFFPELANADTREE